MPPSVPISRSRNEISVQVIAEDLIIERGGKRIIEGLSLKVSAGEALVLVGANGAGKTTLLRTLAGYIEPSAGRLIVTGGTGEATIGEQSHSVGHNNGIKSSLTVFENLAFWSSYLGEGRSEGSIGEALAHFGLEELSDFPAVYLSAGQKRRLGLARLLVVRRPIWLLDEPTAALDAVSSDRFAAAVNAHTSAGGLAIIATHMPLHLERSKSLEIGRQRVAA